MVAQQDSRGANVVFFRNSQNTLILEQRRACAAERAVGRDVDALFLAEVDNLLLGEQRVVLDLVGGRRDGRLCKELLQVLDRVVCDANGFDLVGVRLDQGLHVLPRVNVGDAAIEVARAILELGEERVVALRV